LEKAARLFDEVKHRFDCSRGSGIFMDSNRFTLLLTKQLTPMFRVLLIACHIIVGGAIVVAMIVNPEEMISAGLIPLVLIAGICAGLSARTRWTILPAGLLGLVEVFLVLIITIGNISWSEAVSVQTMVIFGVLIALEVVTVGFALAGFRKKNPG
jgi:hypothetical protein